MLVARGCDQAVGLEESDASLGEGAPPDARLPSRGLVDRQDDETAEQALRGVEFGLAQSSHDLFDIDGGSRRDITAGPKGSNALDGGSTAEIVDQQGRVKNETGSAAIALCPTVARA